MSDNAIVPGVRIGEFCLGDSVQKIKSILERNKLTYSVELLRSAEKISAGDLVFWAKNGRITQIMAQGGYGGKINGAVGIGCTLGQAEECLGRIKEGEYDIAVIYEVENIPGVCFELKDDDEDDESDEFDEMTAPIETICIYND